MTVEGILHRMRTGVQWRDLPEAFGDWSQIYRRFNRWSEKGVMTAIFRFLSSQYDREWLFIDGSIVKAHQDSSCTSNAHDEAIGKSRGGNSTKIHLAVDSGGLPVHFELSGGQESDVKYGESLVSACPDVDTVIADKGYDSEALREFIRQSYAQPFIPRRSNNKAGNDDMDWCLYRYRHLVENAFLKIKKHRAIATRYDKLARNFQSMVSLAFSMMWLPMWVD